jgi:hypothetical protein
MTSDSASKPRSVPEALSQSVTLMIAGRLRQSAAREEPVSPPRMPSYALTRAIGGDLAHLHATHDLRHAAPVSIRRGRAVILRAKVALRRALHPLLDVQSAYNGANARVISILVEQIAQQERSIEALERLVAELHEQNRP